MNKNEIKKALYRTKPVAEFSYIQSGVAHYTCSLVINDITRVVRFAIPVDDMGEAAFTLGMEAHLLNRWIENYE